MGCDSLEYQLLRKRYCHEYLMLLPNFGPCLVLAGSNDTQYTHKGVFQEMHAISIVTPHA